MSEPEYLKCECANCGGHLEYPPEAAGLSLPCPHCRLETLLGAPAPVVEEVESSAPSPASLAANETGEGRGKTGWIVGVVIGLALLGSGGYWFHQHRARQVDRATPKPANGRPALKPKSLEDLKATDIRIERTGGSGLVYAVGDIRNDSDHQRFGIKLELELVDSQGAKVGTATDYAQLIEPRGVWHFRGLVLPAKAVRARLGRIQEEE